MARFARPNRQVAAGQSLPRNAVRPVLARLDPTVIDRRYGKLLAWPGCQTSHFRPVDGAAAHGPRRFTRDCGRSDVVSHEFARGYRTCRRGSDWTVAAHPAWIRSAATAVEPLCYLAAAVPLTWNLWGDPAARLVAGNPHDTDQSTWFMQ